MGQGRSLVAAPEADAPDARARFALRDGFSDVLKGLYSREELIGEPIDVTPNPNVATAAELNETYLGKPTTEAQPAAGAEPQTIEHEEVVAIPIETIEQVAKRRPTASEIVEKEHAELEAKEAEKKADAPIAKPEPTPIALSSSTNYGMMTGEQLKQATKQALADLAEYAGDPEAIAGYWGQHQW